MKLDAARAGGGGEKLRSLPLTSLEVERRMASMMRRKLAGKAREEQRRTDAFDGGDFPASGKNSCVGDTEKGC